MRKHAIRGLAIVSAVLASSAMAMPVVGSMPSSTGTHSQADKATATPKQSPAQRAKTPTQQDQPCPYRRN